MSKSEHIPFVLGGQIIDRRYPEILKPNPLASARRNRTMSQDEWNQFCDDFEAAMSWSRNWSICFLHPAVAITCSLWVTSVAVLIVTRAAYPPIHHHYRNGTLHTSSHGYVYTHPSHSLLTQEILPDVSVFFLLLFALAMAVSMIRMSFQLQENIARVCEEYTIHYQNYYGITFSVQKTPTIASPPWRSNSAKQTRRANEFRSYLLITRQTEDATSRYQNVIQHPQDQLGEPPFFDVVRVPALLPPQTGIHQAFNERSDRNV